MTAGHQPRAWNYADSDIARGWTRACRLSSNTPDWAGDHRLSTKTAHISYRSMDALGVLRAAWAGLSVPPAVVTHLRALTESGALYPFVFDALLGADEAPAQAPHHALAYIRAVMPWQVQNQIWASAVLAGSLPE